DAIVSEDPLPISSLADKVPPALERVVGRCLEKKPNSRFQSARDVAFTLEALLTPIREERTRRFRFARGIAPAIGLIAVLVAGEIATVSIRTRRTLPSFQRLSFQRGQIEWAAFAPDGRTVLYEMAAGGL